MELKPALSVPGWARIFGVVSSVLVLSAVGCSADASADSANPHLCASMTSDLEGCEAEPQCAPVYRTTTKGPVECQARCDEDTRCPHGMECVELLRWDSEDPNYILEIIRAASVCRPTN